MRRASGAGDDDFEPAVLRGLCIGEHALRRAVGADNLYLEWHAPFAKKIGGGLHGFQVALAPHDDPNDRIWHSSRIALLGCGNPKTRLTYTYSSERWAAVL